METFELEVSAGNVPGSSNPVGSMPELAAVNLDLVPAAAVPLRDAPTTEKPMTVGPASAVPTAIPVAQLLADEAITPQQVTIAEAEASPPTAAQSVRRAARQSSWWITSFAVHVLIVLALAFSTLAVMREEQLELYASPAVYEPVEEFEDLEIDLSEDLESLDEEFNEPDASIFEEQTSESLIEEPVIAETPVEESAVADTQSELPDFGQLMGDMSAGSAGMDSAVGEGTGSAMAKFFGTEVKARRILYMLDNSGGMLKGGKFEALVSELKESVSRLGPKQEFYVVFYSDTVYPLFYPQGVRKFVRSNERNRKQLARWLDTVELATGNAIDEALAAAEVIRPDAVFLLTDGNLFTTDKKKEMLLDRMGRRYTIHTFGLGVGEQTKTAAGLQQVAEANGGTFRAIKVTDEMKKLANQIQRPYHRTKPGAVWGLKVGSR